MTSCWTGERRAPEESAVITPSASIRFRSEQEIKAKHVIRCSCWCLVYERFCCCLRKGDVEIEIDLLLQRMIVDRHPYIFVCRNKPEK